MYVHQSGKRVVTDRTCHQLHTAFNFTSVHDVTDDSGTCITSCTTEIRSLSHYIGHSYKYTVHMIELGSEQHKH